MRVTSRSGSGPSPAEQQAITSLNGLNKHDNGRSAVRQSEVRGAEQPLEAESGRKQGAGGWGTRGSD